MGAQRRDDLSRLAERLLRRPERAEVHDLLDAIRGINPTGLDLSRAEEQSRYRTKSSLQSLLIRRFSDEVAISGDREQEGVVLLRHRYADRGGAAHAVVAELDNDARSIVQRRLDAGEDDEEFAATDGARHARPARAVSTSRDEPGAVADLVARGDAARESYDYEAAREHYEAALAQSGGALVAALPLVELLVDYLAADAAALAVATHVAPDAAEHAALRAKLALAAGRSGDRAQVERWLRGVRDTDAATAWLALAGRAISDGRADQAEAFLRSARDASAPAADVVQHEAALAALLRSQWSAADAELEGALAAGNTAGAEARAAEVIAHWPEAPAARRVVAAAKEHRRAREVERLLDEARQAIARGDTAAAGDRSASARTLGADTSALDDAIAATVEAARTRRDGERVEGVVARLSDAGSRDGLLDYLDLPDELRVAVRRDARRPALAWLDQLGVHQGARASAAVAAVVALEALSTSEPDGVLAALAPHEPVLQRFAHGRQRLAEARAMITSRHRAAAEAQLTAAVAALDAGHLDGAKAMLALVDRGALDDAARERLRAAQTRFQERHERLRRSFALGRRLASEDFLGALSAIESLREIVDDAERTRMDGQAAELAQSARQQWPVYDLAVAGTPIAELPCLGAEVAGIVDTLPLTYVLDGEQVVLAFARSRWLFVYAIDVATQRLRRALVIPTPAPLGRCERAAWKDRMWAAGDGHLIEVDLAASAVRAWRTLSEVIPAGTEIDGTHIIPDAGCFWVRDDQGRAQVVDLRRWEILRRVSVGKLTARLPGGREQLVMSFNRHGGADLFAADGAARDRLDDAGYKIHVVVPHPADRRRRLVVVSKRPGEPDHPSPFLLTEIGHRGRFRLKESAGTSALVVLAPSSALAVLAVCAHGPTETRIHGFLAGDDTVPSWTMEVPHRMQLVMDSEARRALALYPTERGIRIVELDQRQPVFEGGVASAGRLPSLTPPFPCNGGLSLAEAFAKSVSDELRGLESEALRAAIVRLREANATIMGNLLSMTAVLPVEERAAHLDFAHGRIPDYVFVDLQRAELDALRGAWDMVVQRLEALVVGPAPHFFHARQHRLHLLGVARVHLGDHEGALAAFREALAIGRSDCPLAECIEWTETLMGTADGSETLADTSSRVVMDALREANSCAASGDLEGARRALERPSVLAHNEGQTLGRLAATYLDSGAPIDDLDRLQRAHLLAWFCDWMESALRTEVCLPGATEGGGRDAINLDTINLDATNWLGASFPRRPLDEGRGEKPEGAG